MVSKNSISSKDYFRGETIMKCNPVVYVVSTEQKRIRCDYCLATSESLRRCSKCKKMFYCGQYCQRSDWKCHQLECEIYEKHYENLKMYSEFRLLLRLCVCVRADPSLQTAIYRCHNEFEVSVDNCEDNEFQLKSDKERKTMYRCFSEKFKELLSPISEEQLHHLYGLTAVKVLGIYCEDLKSLNVQNCGLYAGFGVYPQLVSLKHSCSPNAAYTYDGSQMVVKAMKQIEIGEDVTINYVPIDMSKSERSKYLEMFYIECKCQKCKHDLDSDIDYEQLKDLKRQLSDLAEEVEEDSEKDNDSNRLKIFEIYGKIIDILKKVYENGFHPNYTHAYLCYVKSGLSTLTSREISENGNDFTSLVVAGMDQIKVTHGEDHSLYLELAAFVSNKTNLKINTDKVIRL